VGEADGGGVDHLPVHGHDGSPQARRGPDRHRRLGRPDHPPARRPAAFTTEQRDGTLVALLVPLFQVSPESTARIVSTLLICWRTNPDKTVYTVAVDLDRTPSAASSLAILDRTWSEMS
jgi:hypothetical protein